MKVFSYLIIIFLTPTLILLNFRLLVFNHSFYKSQFTRLGVYQTFSSREIVDYQSNSLIQYFCCATSLSGQFFSPQEILHLADVKNLINFATRLLLINLAFLAVALGILLVKHKKSLAIFSLKWASLTAIITITLLPIASFANFDFFFWQFHRLAFDNNLWQLPAESNLLKLFPPQFFADFANLIAYLTFIMAASTLLISVLLERIYASKKH